jgi:hypothetical protein
MRDERSTGAFQTGLRFLSGKAKPGLAAYRLPIWPIASGSSTKIWLQVRPQAHMTGPQTVTLQYIPRGQRSWKTVGTYTVNSSGFLYRTIHRRGAYWRFTWAGKTSRKAAP